MDSVARELDLPKRAIQDMEEGSRKISLRQIHKLADLYQRPLTVFFMDKLPDVPSPTDYRIDRDKQDLSPQAYLAERRAYYMVSRLFEITRRPSELPNYAEEIGAVDLAKRYRLYLMIDLKFETISKDKLLSFYKQILEDKHRIVIMENEFESKDVRAFSILNDICAIVLNEKDSHAVKLFSLMHEVCHLLRRQSGICYPIANEVIEKPLVERYCDIFASEFLMPDDLVMRESEKYMRPISEENQEKIARRFGVSKLAMSIKLYQKKLVTKPREYHLWNQIPDIPNFDKIENKKKKQTGGGGRNWPAYYRNHIGNYALREVEAAFRDEKITYADVMDITGLNSKYAKELMAL